MSLGHWIRTQNPDSWSPRCQLKRTRGQKLLGYYLFPSPISFIIPCVPPFVQESMEVLREKTNACSGRKRRASSPVVEKPKTCPQPGTSPEILFRYKRKRIPESRLDAVTVKLSFENSPDSTAEEQRRNPRRLSSKRPRHAAWEEKVERLELEEQEYKRERHTKRTVEKEDEATEALMMLSRDDPEYDVQSIVHLLNYMRSLMVAPVQNNAEQSGGRRVSRRRKPCKVASH